MSFIPPGMDHHAWLIRLVALVFLAMYAGQHYGDLSPGKPSAPEAASSMPAKEMEKESAGPAELIGAAAGLTSAAQGGASSGAEPPTATGGWLQEKIDAYMKTEDGALLQAVLAARAARKETGGDSVALLAAQKRPDRPYKTDVKSGEGAPLVCGKQAKLHWKLYDARHVLLDSTYEGEPVTFTPGDGSVPPGLERAVTGMRPGGVRRVIVPGALAYDGERFTSALVTPGQPVIFTVELTEAAPPPAELVLPVGTQDPPGAMPGQLCGMQLTVLAEGEGRRRKLAGVLGRKGAFPPALTALLAARAEGSAVTADLPRDGESLGYARAAPEWTEQQEDAPEFPPADSPPEELTAADTQNAVRYRFTVTEAR